MDIQLNADLEQIVNSQVRSGRFANRQEVIEAGLILLDGMSIDERSRRAESFRQTISETLANHKPGDEVPFDRQAIRNAGMALLTSRKHAK